MTPARPALLSERNLAAALLIAFLLVGGLYSVVVPIFEVSDELRHYPMIKTLADGNGLPVQNPAHPGPWRQEGSQPPLYYAIGAAATFWIDTSDFDAVWRLNPHVDNGVITPDGNVNMVVHNYQAERWPWHGTVLAVHIIRFLSVVMSAGSVYFTYRIGLELFPDWRWLALAGAAVAAFTPMFGFISGSVNNDNLATLLASLSVWLMLRIIEQVESDRPTLIWTVALGAALGCGAITKQSVLGLFGLAGITMAYAALRQRSWQTFFLEGPLIVGMAVVIAGWWYLRNWRLYGEVFGLNRMIAVAGARPGGTASLVQLWGERTGFIYSYWGLFGGVNIPLPDWAYLILNVLSAVSLIGLVIWAITRWRQWSLSWPVWMPRLLTLLWIPFVFIPLVRWTSLTQASQGRLMFSAISALSLWFIVGLVAWMPDRWGKVSAGVIAAFLGGLSVAAPLAWIAPLYKPPPQIAVPTESYLAAFAPPGASQPVMRLLNASYEPEAVQPGDQVTVSLEWEVVAPMDRNWSVFVHLQDSARLLAGQRDTYPGIGLLATGDLPVGRRWRDTAVLTVRESAYAPETLKLRVGLYDYTNGERMMVDDGSDSIQVGEIRLLPRSGDVPNPVGYNYAGKMLLHGYEIDTRQVAPGSTTAVTLYWEGLAPMDTNYSVSVQLVNEDGQVAGARDSWPLNGDAPTISWEPGQRLIDAYDLPVAADAVPGVYDVQVIVYSVSDDGQIAPLRRQMPGGRLVDDRILLTKVWVTP